MLMMELPQKGFFHELLVVRFHNKVHLAISCFATKSHAHLSNFLLRRIFRFAPGAAVFVIVEMMLERGTHRRSKTFVSASRVQPECPTEASFHPFCVRFCRTASICNGLRRLEKKEAGVSTDPVAFVGEEF